VPPYYLPYTTVTLFTSHGGVCVRSLTLPKQVVELQTLWTNDEPNRWDHENTLSRAIQAISSSSID